MFSIDNFLSNIPISLLDVPSFSELKETYEQRFRGRLDAKLIRKPLNIEFGNQSLARRHQRENMAYGMF